MPTQTKKSIDYWEIVKKAFQITFKHKYLWLFGLFLGASGGGFNFYNFNSGDLRRRGADPGKAKEEIGNFFANQWYIFLIIGLVILFLLLIFCVLTIISQGALIGCVDKIARGKKTGLKDGFSTGFRYFWRILGTGLIFGILSLIIFLFLGIPTFLLFYFKLWLPAILLLLFSILIFIPLAILISFLANYSLRFIVIKNLKIVAAIKEAWKLFRKNIGPTILITLILLLVGFVAGFIFLFVLVILIIPLVLLAIPAYLVAKIVGLIIVAVVGLALLLLISFIYSAILNTFSSASWTLFFREILKRNQTS